MIEMMVKFLLDQFNLTEDLINGKSGDDIYRQIITKKGKIDIMKMGITKKLSAMIISFEPKAGELREIIACQEIILFLADIGDLLVDADNYLIKSDLNLPEYIELKSHLKKTFASLKRITGDCIWSYLLRDEREAHQIIEEKNDMETSSQEIYETLIAGFQEIPLSGREIVSILHLHSIVYILEKIRKNAINIAKSTIFAIEGFDYKYQGFEM
jgi:phosphate uptake regulator